MKNSPRRRLQKSIFKKNYYLNREHWFHSSHFVPVFFLEMRKTFLCSILFECGYLSIQHVKTYKRKGKKNKKKRERALHIKVDAFFPYFIFFFFIFFSVRLLFCFFSFFPFFPHRLYLLYVSRKLPYFSCRA